MTTPLLSICIPTYNRSKLLAYCIDNLRALDTYGIAYEIVVVDHASPDDTPEVMEEIAAKYANIRYYRQTQQVGIERQLASALRMARGTFCVYVADDDKIIPEKLVEYVRYLEAHSEVSAIYAPWWAYDDAEEKIIHGYFEVPERTTFKIADPLAMIDFMTSRLVWPESVIYRREALHNIMVSRNDGPYQAFPMAYALLKKGNVVFEKEPFYLEVANPKPQFAVGRRMNVAINLTYLDNIRGALEMTIERILLDSGTPQLPNELRLNVHEALLNYAHHRLGVAFRRALHAKQFIQASELAQRLLLWRGNTFEPNLIGIANEIYGLTGLQAVVQLAQGSSWMKRLYIYGFKQPADIIEAFKNPENDLKLKITEASLKTIIADTEPDYCLVLVKDTADRAAFAESKLPPGNIIVLKEMADYYQIFPAIRDFNTL